MRPATDSRPRVTLPSAQDRLPAQRIGAKATGPVDAAELATLLSGLADPIEPGAAEAGQGVALFVVVNRVAGLAGGIYRYLQVGHELVVLAGSPPAARLASCAAEPGPLLAADVVLGLATDTEPGGSAFPPGTDADGDRGDPVLAAFRSVRLGAELGLNSRVVAGFVDGIGELLGLPATGSRSRILVAFERMSADRG